MIEHKQSKDIHTGMIKINKYVQVGVLFVLCNRNVDDRAGLVFTKGLRLSQVLGLNPVLKLRLLSQLSFVLKPYSQRVT